MDKTSNLAFSPTDEYLLSVVIASLRVYRSEPAPRHNYFDNLTGAGKLSLLLLIASIFSSFLMSFGGGGSS